MPLVPLSALPPPWYHAAPALVADGTIFLPGNMGRIINYYEKTSARLLQEKLFEAARTLVTPNLPSRLSCIFLCPSIDDAIAFALTDTPKLCQWYEVEPVEPPGSIFVTDIRYWSAENPLSKEAVASYWAGPVGETHREILYPGPVRVRSMIEDMRTYVPKLRDTEEGRARLRRLGIS